MLKKRKIPLRVCIGCQETKPKKELVRIVRTPEEKITLDLTGKKPGRGAYICPMESCLKKAIKGKRLEKNLQMPVSPDLITDLNKLLSNQPKAE
ncbi:MAG: RNase P modulator RnpM [Bacillota bacterium]